LKTPSQQWYPFASLDRCGCLSRDSGAFRVFLGQMSQYNEETEQSGTANLTSLRLPNSYHCQETPWTFGTETLKIHQQKQDIHAEQCQSHNDFTLVVSTKHLNTPSVGQLTNPGQSRAYFPAFDPIAQEAHDVQREQQKLCKWKVPSFQRLVSIFHQQQMFAALSDLHLGSISWYQINNARVWPAAPRV